MMLGCMASHAQLPDTAAMSELKRVLQLRLVEIEDHVETAKTNIRELKTGYRPGDKDSAFSSRLTALKNDRRRWKTEYNAWRKANNQFAKAKEKFDREMLGYYRTQSFYEYRNRSRLNRYAGLAIVTTGGLVFLGGLIHGMTELPTTAAPEGQKNNQRITVACLAAGGVLALSSIPFFKAARKNIEIYKSHIVWNMDVLPIRLPNGFTKSVLGFQAHIPLFGRYTSGND